MMALMKGLTCVLALLVLGELATAAERTCYVCSSYMEQCKERVYVNRDYVHKTKCKSACFVRKGDDDALYRGCFDGFLKVEDLKVLSTMTGGCVNVTWNNRDLPWCMCDGDLCNAESMYTLGYQSSGKQVVNAGYAKEGPAAPAPATQKYYYGQQGEQYEAPFQAETGYTEDKQQQQEDVYQPEYQPVQYQQPAQYQQYQQQQQNEAYPQQPQQYVEQEYEQQIDVNHAADPYYNGGSYQDQNEYPLDDFVEHLKQGDDEAAYEAEYDPYNQNPYANQVQEDYPPEDLYVAPPTKKPDAFPQHLAARIQCAKTGFYQNPDDCRTFVACILDPHYRMPYMHLMRCPDGLVWDNDDKICMDYSTTCNIGGSPVPETQQHQDTADYYAAQAEYDAAQVQYDAAQAQYDAAQAYYAQDDQVVAAAAGVESAPVDYYGAAQENSLPAGEPAYYEPIDAAYQPK